MRMMSTNEWTDFISLKISQQINNWWMIWTSIHKKLKYITWKLDTKISMNNYKRMDKPTNNPKMKIKNKNNIIRIIIYRIKD